MKITVGCLILIVIFGLGSCNQNKKPKNVLSEQQLAEILVDIYAGEARMTNLSLVNDSAIKLFRPFEESLFQKKGIPDSIVKTTFRYYLAHPVELEQVYDVVIDTLSLREKKTGIKLR